ncbi:MAG: DNA-3-methyladenine glycosylase [Planctomycetota bacterium]
MTVLDRSAYAVPADELARSLLGCTLVRRLDDGTRLAGTIVETEAYLGVRDKAAHSKGARRTPRTEPMFGPGGTAYVFLIYGMHRCFNIAAATPGDPQAVLIRALEPVLGLSTMRAHRAQRSRAANPAALPDHLVCSGPGRLCDALGIDLGMSGLDVADRDSKIRVEQIQKASGGVPTAEIGTSSRIGVDYAEEWKDALLRFFIRGSRAVSGPASMNR